MSGRRSEMRGSTAEAVVDQIISKLVNCCACCLFAVVRWVLLLVFAVSLWWIVMSEMGMENVSDM